MAQTAKVALLQLAAFDASDSEASLAHTLRRIEDAAREHKPDIIALPEVTYPGYFLGSQEVADEVDLEAATSRLSDLARAYGVYIAAGWAVDIDGRLRNSALLFGRDGALVGRYDKTFLWHFDHKWFDEGSSYPVFETDFGRVGMLICADGRMPEIARSLTMNGAQVILDLTAWVSGARSRRELTTTQISHLMRCRAAENGIWIACADKCGVEAESIVYAGQSCVINPRGEIVERLDSEREGTLVYDVPLADAALPVMRRPQLYDTLAYPTASLPVLQTLSETIVAPAEERRIAVVQMTIPESTREFVERATAHVERQATMDASIVVFPAPPTRYRQAFTEAALTPAMEALARRTGVTIAYCAWAPDGNGLRYMYLMGPAGLILRHAQSHKPPGERFATMPLGDSECEIAATAAGKAGMVIAAEGMVPEVARSLMLRGAEFILWSADSPSLEMEMVARTRAEENRVFVACAAAPTDRGATMIADPNGRVLAIALEGEELAVGAEVNRMAAHVKERSPGTNVVLNRQPATYGALVAVPVQAGAAEAG